MHSSYLFDLCRCVGARSERHNYLSTGRVPSPVPNVTSCQGLLTLNPLEGKCSELNQVVHLGLKGWEGKWVVALRQENRNLQRAYPRIIPQFSAGFSGSNGLPHLELHQV